MSASLFALPPAKYDMRRDLRAHAREAAFVGGRRACVEQKKKKEDKQKFIFSISLFPLHPRLLFLLSNKKYGVIRTRVQAPAYQDRRRALSAHAYFFLQPRKVTRE